jgi:phosphate-selective porin OprO/OprP
MYDGLEKTWFMRETGVMVKLKEAKGHIFIGRTKEGFSLSKVMVGYAIWHLERNTGIDVIPILADGIKYIGYLEKQKIIWNLGAYTDWLSEGQSFSTYKYQVVSRVGWLPVYSEPYKPVLHIGGNYRYGKVKDGEIRVRSKPEVSGAPYWVDSDVFSSDYSNSFGGELYYRKGPFLFGSEYNVHKFHAPEKGNPLFGGGEAFVAYMFTGEVKPYYTFNGIFGFIKVKNPVFQGGWGAIEGILRISNMDIEDGTIEGGKYWRLTPMVNWFLNDHIRLFVNYGYAVLDRNEIKGTTHFFQARVLFSI